LLEKNLNIYDVIIIGSGPAGSSAAYVLSKEGKKVLVLEKEKLPRYKTCGGGLTYKALKLIPFDLTEIIEKNCYSSEINDYEGNVSFKTQRENPMVLMTMRSSLDYKLISEAKAIGAELKENTEVKDLNLFDDRIEIIIKNSNEKFYAKFIIAADGALSPVAKKFFKALLVKPIPALECEVYVDDKVLQNFKSSARFDFGVVPNGYGWVFPKRDHLSIGVLSMKIKDVNLNNSYLRYLELLGINKIIKSERHGFVIPLNTRKIFFKDRILLTGDAAGFADPVTGEGISFAIQSGQLAAESIINGNFNPVSVCSGYNTQISRHILPELKAGKFLASLIYGNSGLRVWIIKLYGKKLSELITDVVMGEKKYNELVKDPLNYFKLFFKWTLRNKPRQKVPDNINTIQTSV
jgi:geranylgeranyl reductase family protein